MKIHYRVATSDEAYRAFYAKYYYEGIVVINDRVYIWSGPGYGVKQGLTIDARYVGLWGVDEHRLTEVFMQNYLGDNVSSQSVTTLSKLDMLMHSAFALWVASFTELMPFSKYLESL